MRVRDVPIVLRMDEEDGCFDGLESGCAVELVAEKAEVPLYFEVRINDRM